MENKTMKIIPPEGYEIDKEKSTFEEIVFKPIIAKRWRDNLEASIGGYYIDLGGIILGCNQKNWHNTIGNYNIFATEAQAKSAIAMARISQIMDNDERFGGAITDKEWKDKDIQKFVIKCEYKDECPSGYSLYVGWSTTTKYFIAFHTRAQARLFIDENEDLLKDYFMV